METLGHILLEMNADEVHFLVRRGNIFLRIFRIRQVVQRHPAVCAKRHVVLRDLIILRHVRIEIIFPVELRDWRNVAVEHQSGQHRHAQRFVIRYRQRARQTKTDRTSVCVRRRAKFHRARAKHLRARLQLDVNLQSNCRDIIHCCFWVA